MKLKRDKIRCIFGNIEVKNPNKEQKEKLIELSEKRLNKEGNLSFTLSDYKDFILPMLSNLNPDDITEDDLKDPCGDFEDFMIEVGIIINETRRRFLKKKLSEIERNYDNINSINKISDYMEGLKEEDKNKIKDFMKKNVKEDKEDTLNKLKELGFSLDDLKGLI